MNAPLISLKENENNVSAGVPGFNQSIDLSPRSSYHPSNREQSVIARIGIPSLDEVCRDLQLTFFEQKAPYSALQFVPVLNKMTPLGEVAITRILENSKTSHVLVQNDLIRVVLIHWNPGKFSDIHGHPKGGCVFKVLKGTLEEKRYSADESQKHLATSTFEEGAMAYIDDNMALHAVGNPFDISAISLHVYTPGRK